MTPDVSSNVFTDELCKTVQMVSNEKARRMELHRYEILDSSPEAEFDRITELAAVICNVPIALISLVDADRQWFKSNIGMRAEQTDRRIAFCNHTILGDEILEVEDALKDMRFKDNPLVTSEPNIRFYAGIPLKSPRGFNIGSLCVINSDPQRLTHMQRNVLESLAAQVVQLLELRLQLRRETRIGEIKGKIIAKASHQFKTPLTVIQSNAELLQLLGQSDQCSDELSEKLSRYTLRISKETDRMNNMVKDILELTQITTTKRRLTPHSWCVLKMVDAMIERFATLYPSRPPKLIVNGDPRELEVDRHHISEALSNLLSNAYKYSTNTAPELRVDFEENSVSISVSDQGIGVPDNQQSRLFEPYFRANNAREHPGTGLGLTIAKEYVELNNGKLLLESTLNKGATFTIIFSQI